MMCNGTLWDNEISKQLTKIRSNLTWQIEHVLAKVPAKNAVQKTRQAARGDDRAGTRRTKQPESLENSEKTLYEVLIPVFLDFSIMLP